MNTKIKIHLMPYELRCLDLALDELLEPNPDADAYERCAVSVLSLWHMKIKTLALYPNPKGNKVSLDAPTAYALRAILDFKRCNPADAFHVKLLQIDDAIQKVFFSPVFFIPQLPKPQLQYSSPPNPNAPILTHPNQIPQQTNG